MLIPSVGTFPALLYTRMVLQVQKLFLHFLNFNFNVIFADIHWNFKEHSSPESGHSEAVASRDAHCNQVN